MRTLFVPKRTSETSMSIERWTHSWPFAPGTLSAGGSTPAFVPLIVSAAVPVPPTERMSYTSWARAGITGPGESNCSETLFVGEGQKNWYDVFQQYARDP